MLFYLFVFYLSGLGDHFTVFVFDTQKGGGGIIYIINIIYYKQVCVWLWWGYINQ